MTNKNNKTTKQKTKTNAVNTYRDVSQVFKTNLITDVNQALSNGTITLESETEKTRFLSLLNSLIDVHQANGHELFSRLIN
jgi:hypothetical protein